VTRRNAYRGAARALARSADPGLLAYALLLSDPAAASRALDWPAFRVALVAAGVDPDRAATLTRQAKAGAAVLLKAGTLDATAFGAALGLTADQARTLIRMQSYLVGAKVPEAKALAMLRTRARELAGAHLAPQPKSAHLAAGRRDFLAMDAIADRAAPRVQAALGGIQRAVLAGQAATLERLRAVLEAAQGIAGRAAADTLARRLGRPAPYFPAAPGAQEWAAERAEGLARWLKEATAAEGAALAPERIRQAASAQAYGAAQEGQRQAWKQAADAGLLRANARRTWVTRGDGGVCYRCDPLDGQQRGLDEPFDSIGDRSLVIMNPGDAHQGWRTECRCAVLIDAVAA
jgi:hypothetical protein